MIVVNLIATRHDDKSTPFFCSFRTIVRFAGTYREDGDDSRNDMKHINGGAIPLHAKSASSYHQA
jgi:hypothetical protein